MQDSREATAAAPCRATGLNRCNRHVQATTHTQAPRDLAKHVKEFADNKNRRLDHAMLVEGCTTGSASAAKASSTRSSARWPSGSASNAVAAFASACRASSRRSCRSWKLCRKNQVFRVNPPGLTAALSPPRGAPAAPGSSAGKTRILGLILWV